ncbi:regulator of chromosome condensation 1/beta-lactamase-inhibitor protein II, partial [Coniochaeta sp. 2T2.1]
PPKVKTARPGVGRPRKTAAPAAPTILNTPPTQVLTVFTFGTGDCGELGLGPKQKSALRPRPNKFLDPTSPDGLKVVQLAVGGMHVVALTADNKIVTWGVNDKGALGRDTAWEGKLRDMDADDSSDDDDDDLNPIESTPTALPDDAFPAGTVFVQVAAGDSCSLALTETGLVYGWGTFLSSDGKPGFFYNPKTKDLITDKARPYLLPDLKDIVQITCGSNHALALDKTGTIWAWGIGEQNQLGRRLLPGRERTGFAPTRVGIARNKVKYIASGPFHSFAVDGRDNVWAWGLSSDGEAGHYNPRDRGSLPYPMKIDKLAGKGVVLLDGGAHHSVAVASSGECFVWGRIEGGQLGVQFTPEQLADEDLVEMTERGKPGICMKPVPVTHIGEAAYAVAASGHTIFINKEGKAYSAGFGFMGQLGHGNEEDVEVAKLIEAKSVKDRKLTWAGAGGQFSMVAGPADEQSAEAAA